MKKYQNISEDYFSICLQLAQAWRTESRGWHDCQEKQLSKKVMQPVSQECQYIKDLLSSLDRVLTEMLDKGLIQDK